MKIVKIKGGIGNQLFQYAFALTLKKETDDNIKLDFLSCYGTKDQTCLDVLKKFNLSLEEASKKEIKDTAGLLNHYPLLSFRYRVSTFLAILFCKSYFFEKNREYLDVKKIKDFSYFDGYWQSWKYANHIKDILEKDLIPVEPLSEKAKEMIAQVSSENSVFIGIRRGDYVSSRKSRKRYDNFSMSYYLSSIKAIKEKVEDPVFYVFSNDIEWCKKNVDFGDNIVVYREKDNQVSDFEELLIMSNCKHAIILNSTFHWWAAFLIKNKKKIVIAPSEWFADGTKVDIIPPEWIKMNREGEIIK